ncbi:hypothetical protein BSPWISOXPB_9574 [uncultured Gammaproteobacteria bacterium]|nr:hypothetical protein BSPWISOXPB_9574 [uncultured Gammaproteobacteria bacterium]
MANQGKKNSNHKADLENDNFVIYRQNYEFDFIHPFADGMAKWGFL